MLSRERCGEGRLLKVGPGSLLHQEGANDDPEDAALGAELLKSAKDRAEHIMLVDLARNDVNRVCQPLTVKVDELMKLERFSHVIHMTSQVSGMLRPGKTR